MMEARASLTLHPLSNRLKLSHRQMMIRNYFQAMGHNGLTRSLFVICWTADGANGTTRLTSDKSGIRVQDRIAAKYNIPVYNLCDQLYTGMNAADIVDMILDNLKNGININAVKNVTTTSLF